MFIRDSNIGRSIIQCSQTVDFKTVPALCIALDIRLQNFVILVLEVIGCSVAAFQCFRIDQRNVCGHRQCIRADVIDVMHSELKKLTYNKDCIGIMREREDAVRTPVLDFQQLCRKKRTSFLSLFESSSDRSEVVATFLAVLELMKNKRRCV